jgi:hypothetical protein
VSALLVATLIVSIANLLLLGAYLAHELGWFPHGKSRGLATRTFTRCDRPAHLEGKRFLQRPLGIERPHPLADILRRVGHSDVYGAPDLADELAKAIAHCREHPSDWSRRDDLLGLANELGAQSERTEHENNLIEEAIVILVSPQEKDDEEGRRP